MLILFYIKLIKVISREARMTDIQGRGSKHFHFIFLRYYQILILFKILLILVDLSYFLKGVRNTLPESPGSLADIYNGIFKLDCVHWIGSRVGPLVVRALLGNIEQLIFIKHHVSDCLDPCDLLLLPPKPKPPSQHDLSRTMPYGTQLGTNSLFLFLLYIFVTFHDIYICRTLESNNSPKNEFFYRPKNEFITHRKIGKVRFIKNSLDVRMILDQCSVSQ